MATPEAVTERRWRIRLLRACECDYPLKTYRNGSGHAQDCPAHALWTEHAR